jgi:hypothetical protein
MKGPRQSCGSAVVHNLRMASQPFPTSFSTTGKMNMAEARSSFYPWNDIHIPMYGCPTNRTEQ